MEGSEGSDALHVYPEKETQSPRTNLQPGCTSALVFACYSKVEIQYPISDAYWVKTLNGFTHRAETLPALHTQGPTPHQCYIFKLHFQQGKRRKKKQKNFTSFGQPV